MIRSQMRHIFTCDFFYKSTNKVFQVKYVTLEYLMSYLCKLNFDVI